MLVLALGACATPGTVQVADFSLDTVDGAPVRLSSHVGRDVVLLSFWATWCAPCLAELPALEAIYQRYRPQGFTVLAVSMDGPETLAGVEATVRRLGVTYPVLLDPETRVTAQYNPARAAPYGLLFARDGRVAHTLVAYAPGDERALEDRVAALVAE